MTSSIATPPLIGLAAVSDRAYSDPTVRNVIYGETVHEYNEFFREFVSPNHLDALKNRNITTIRVELPASEQKNADLLASRQMTRENFLDKFKNNFRLFDNDLENSAERYELIADLITRAAERGIKVKLVDTMLGVSKDLNAPEVISHSKVCQTNFRAELTGKDLEFIADEIRQWQTSGKISDNNMWQSFIQFEKCMKQNPQTASMLRGLDERFGGDFDLGKAAGEDSRVAFFYGARHGAGIAKGFPGKSIGIAGVHPDSSLFTKTAAPYFQYHYDTLSGTLSEPFKKERLRASAQPVMELGSQP